MVEQISVKEALDLDCVFVDVRAPVEFEKDHILDAVNIPLLSDEERAIVGTLYKESPGNAYAKGFEFVMPKAKEIHDKLMSFSKPVVVYCWRGGLRSKSVVSLVSRDDVYQLKGGYKKYREWVRNSLEDYNLKQKVVVLHGYSCVDKTKILNQLPNSVDLEGLAQHRGSVFGAMGLKPNTQKMFESLLLRSLLELRHERFIVVEGESRKIGDLHVPSFLYGAMCKGVNVLIKDSIENRMKVFLDEYKILDKPDEFVRILRTLNRKMSKKYITEIEDLIAKKEYVEAAKILFEKYYDPLYDYSMNKLDYALVVESSYLEKIKEFLKLVDESEKSRLKVFGI